MSYIKIETKEVGKSGQVDAVAVKFDNELAPKFIRCLNVVMGSSPIPLDMVPRIAQVEMQFVLPSGKGADLKETMLEDGFIF